MLGSQDDIFWFMQKSCHSFNFYLAQFLSRGQNDGLPYHLFLHPTNVQVSNASIWFRNTGTSIYKIQLALLLLFFHVGYFSEARESLRLTAIFPFPSVSSKTIPLFTYSTQLNTTVHKPSSTWFKYLQSLST